MKRVGETHEIQRSIYASNHDVQCNKGIGLQGGESGGHGRKGGATTLCLLPEVMDAVDAACAQHGLPRIPVLAAGGICDGRQACRPAALHAGVQGWPAAPAALVFIAIPAVARFCGTPQHPQPALGRICFHGNATLCSP